MQDVVYRCCLRQHVCLRGRAMSVKMLRKLKEERVWGRLPNYKGRLPKALMSPPIISCRCCRCMLERWLIVAAMLRPRFAATPEINDVVRLVIFSIRHAMSRSLAGLSTPAQYAYACNMRGHMTSSDCRQFTIRSGASLSPGHAQSAHCRAANSRNIGQVATIFRAKYSSRLTPFITFWSGRQMQHALSTCSHAVQRLRLRIYQTMMRQLPPPHTTPTSSPGRAQIIAWRCRRAQRRCHFKK